MYKEIEENSIKHEWTEIKYKLLSELDISISTTIDILLYEGYSENNKN